MATHETKLLTVSEVAQRLRVSRTTVWRWVHAGRLRALRVGRGIRVREEDVERVAEPATPKATSAVAWSYQQGDLDADPDEVMRRLRQLHERMLRRRGGTPLRSSVDVIRQSREERMGQL
ncbi:MAG: helix-turn-helix domain-containing protein [Dehalococcoidia bacterium]